MGSLGSAPHLMLAREVVFVCIAIMVLFIINFITIMAFLYYGSVT